MLKFFGLLLFTLQVSWAIEPERIFVVSNGKVQEVSFNNLKRVELVTTNYHPNFSHLGKIRYSGFLIKDILPKLDPETPITIVGNTGQFSVELKAKELLTGNNIIATHVNGEPVKTNGNGLQIIYDEETINKYPHLKQRSFWCWWVRSFITDSKHYVKADGLNKTLSSKLPWPSPYGISSIEKTEAKSRKGIVLDNFKKLKVKFLNGNEKEIIADAKTKFFLAEPTNNKNGAYGLHQMIVDKDEVQTFVSNLYYVKDIEVVR